MAEGEESEKGPESNSNEQEMRTSQTYEKSWTLKSKKVTEHLIISM